MQTPDKPPLVFSTVTGEVFSSMVGSETKVTSSGGGGVIVNGSGYISAPTISSTSTRTQEFWLRSPEGTQTPVQWKDMNLSVADGQTVTLVYAGVESKSKTLIAAYNQSSREYLYLGLSENDLRYITVYPARAWSLALPFVAVGLSFVYSYAFAIAGVLYTVWRARPRLARRKAMSALVAERIESALAGLPPGSDGAAVRIEPIPAGKDKIVIM